VHAKAIFYHIIFHLITIKFNTQEMKCLIVCFSESLFLLRLYPFFSLFSSDCPVTQRALYRSNLQTRQNLILGKFYHLIVRNFRGRRVDTKLYLVCKGNASLGLENWPDSRGQPEISVVTLYNRKTIVPKSGLGICRSLQLCEGFAS